MPASSRPSRALRFVIVGVSLCLLGLPASADESPHDEPMVIVGTPLRQHSYAIDDALKRALKSRDWSTAITNLERTSPDSLVGKSKGDWAFLLAWCLTHSDRGDEAFRLLPLIERDSHAPETYTALIRGEIHKGRGEWLQALESLAQVADSSVIYPRAAIQKAEVLRELGRTKEAFDLYEALVLRPDPAEGNDEALLALAVHYGVGSDKSYPYLRRVWSGYPRTQASVRATKMLKTYAGRPGFKASWIDVGKRAERLMYQGDYLGAIAETDRRVGEAVGRDEDTCRFRYVRGRSYYKKNQLTNAVNAFGDVGTRCAEADGDYGPKSLYLKSTAQFRRRDYTGSAKSWQQIPDLYPSHSMADDGLTQGGIALLEAGDLAGAQAMWRRALEVFPDGDTVPEATWRLAFSLYMDGDPSGAIEVAEALGQLPLKEDAVHVQAGRYWAARWKAYPDVDNPNVRVDDEEAVALATEEWRDLIEESPHSFYAILAGSRLYEVAPEVAAELAIRSEGHGAGDLSRPWVVRLSFYENPAVQDAVALARLGLIREARSEWSPILDDLRGDEMAWLMELRIMSGDWLYAHDAFRRWIRSHPVGTLGPRQAQVIRVAYPDRYWDLVQNAAQDDRYDPRLFHALVREESNFNRRIVSFAGAVGLSQLMPATAKETCGWMGKTYSLEALNDPETNLSIGARYLDAMHKQLSDSPYLSLAAYNAGAGRVGQWRRAWGNVPTDEYVERIPFRETREYVKRVMGTWQVMRFQFDDTAAIPDLSAFNHQALPER
jgi:soluble lytic murein transglycosylase